jgi:hypothetical protein
VDTGTERGPAVDLTATSPAEQGRFYRTPPADPADDLAEAKQLEGLDEEIAELRVRLKDALHKDKTDLGMALRAMNVLVRAVLAQQRISPRESKGLFARYAETLAGFHQQLTEGPGTDESHQPLD